MATYRQIQEWVKAHHGFTRKTCWIAHCKELFGLEPRRSPNHRGTGRMNPYPVDKRGAIMDAFAYYGVLPSD